MSRVVGFVLALLEPAHEGCEQAFRLHARPKSSSDRIFFFPLLGHCLRSRRCRGSLVVARCTDARPHRARLWFLATRRSPAATSTTSTTRSIGLVPRPPCVAPLLFTVDSREVTLPRLAARWSAQDTRLSRVLPRQPGSGSPRGRFYFSKLHAREVHVVRAGGSVSGSRRAGWKHSARDALASIPTLHMKESFHWFVKKTQKCQKIHIRYIL